MLKKHAIARRGRRKSTDGQLALPVRLPSKDGHNLTGACEIVPVEKRRDGGTRYWCLKHRADATAKYGRRAKTCRFAHLPLISDRETLHLIPEDYPGGVALWGAVAPIYDTTRRLLDRGIHVHARPEMGGKKEMDVTVRAVRLSGTDLPPIGVVVSELDAIYYMVSSVAGYETKRVECPYCGFLHLDRDWFSVHPHRRHLCAGCGKHFRDTDVGIGNPIQMVRAACGIATGTPRPAAQKLNIRQSQYAGGIQIWGSNAAFLWTSRVHEEEGIHVHAFDGDDDEHPVLDETYSEVVIDGVSLDPTMVRLLMAQTALPHLKERVTSIDCPSCGAPTFSIGERAFLPSQRHQCEACRREFRAPGRVRKTVANPLPAILARLADTAPRQPQVHEMALIPEMP